MGFVVIGRRNGKETECEIIRRLQESLPEERERFLRELERILRRRREEDHEDQEEGPGETEDIHTEFRAFGPCNLKPTGHLINWYTSGFQ